MTLNDLKLTLLQIGMKAPKLKIPLRAVLDELETLEFDPGRTASFRLRPQEKAVIEAFVQSKAAEGRLLSSDGRILERIGGLGRERVARHRGRHISILSTESVKSDMSILRYLEKVAKRAGIPVHYPYKTEVAPSLKLEVGGDAGYHGQWNGWIKAYVPEQSQPVGLLLWSKAGGAYQIDGVGVSPPFQRTGIAAAMYQRLLKDQRIRMKDLQTSGLTPDGAELRKRLGSVPTGSDVALLTLNEYIRILDPDDKTHGSDSYLVTLADLNPHSTPNWPVGGYVLHPVSLRPLYKVHTSYGDANTLTFYSMKDEDKLEAIYVKGQWWVSPTFKHDGIPAHYYTHQRASGDVKPLKANKVKMVKYVDEYRHLIDKTVAVNLKRYPHVIKQFKRRNEFFTLRLSSAGYTKDSGEMIGIMNAKGQVIAQAQDEWGATLVRVASEYKGHGMGEILAETWSIYNPKYLSGGFTPQGRQMRRNMWARHVREFLSQGGYRKLLSQNQITLTRIQEILAGLPDAKAWNKDHSPKLIPNLPQFPVPEARKAGEMRVYLDNDGTTFVYYDSRFLEEQDAKHIKGYGFLRSQAGIGTYFYSLDYDPQHVKDVYRIAFQLARLNRTSLYVGDGYADMMELDKIPEAERHGNYVEVKRDIFPLKQEALKERKARKPLDPYRELEYSLIEEAESKWT